MSRHVIIKLITIWIVIWLPISGALASTMQIVAAFNGVQSSTLEKHGEDTSPDAMAFLPCHQNEADNDDMAETGGAWLKKTSCSHCTLCHIAASIMPATMPIVDRITHHDCPQSIDSVSFTSFIPELPMRPPSLSAAA